MQILQQSLFYKAFSMWPEFFYSTVTVFSIPYPVPPFGVVLG